MEIPKLVGAGLVVIGAGLGIGKIGAAAFRRYGSSARTSW